MREAYRASIFHCLADPGENDAAAAIEYFEDGVLLVEDGRITEVGAANSLLGSLSEDTRVEDLSGKLIVPGFVDCHVHYVKIVICGFTHRTFLKQDSGIHQFTHGVLLCRIRDAQSLPFRHL